MGIEAAVLGPLIGAGGSILSGVMGSQASGAAAAAQERATMAAIAENRAAREQAFEATATPRDAAAGALRLVAGQFGLPMGTYNDPASGLTYPAQAAGPSLDRYQDPNRRKYTDIAAPYLSELKDITGRIGGVANMFTGTMEDGQPEWYRNALASFKQSPGYEFARDEALRQFNQSARGNIMGGGRLMGGTRLASGYAAQDYDKFRDNIINSIMGGSKLGLVGLQQQAESLTGRHGMEAGAETNEDARYTNFFNRLLSAAGLGNAATTATVQAGTEFGGNAAKLAQNLGTNEARGILGSANALSQGFQGATNYLTGPGGPFSPYNYASSTDMAGTNYGGGGGGDINTANWTGNYGTYGTPSGFGGMA